MDATEAWQATLGELQLQMTKATFNTWLKETQLVSYDNNMYVIGVRNDYAKDWLENRLHDTILRTLVDVAGDGAKLRFVVLADGETAVSTSTKTDIPPSTKSTPNTDSNKRGTGSLENKIEGTAVNGTLNRQNTFATFVVGASNRLAHAAALSVAENPGDAYNPLFIYGGVGLGKTHLLHAIGRKCRDNGYNVAYISSETFTNDLIQSIRSKQMEDFRQRYRTPDVLMIDDIQFIAGKESTQEELFHTFNELHNQGKQLIISSDRPPKAMATLEERLQSRFEWGLMADIQMPDVETRKAILQSKAEEMNLNVPDYVFDTIAQHVRNNIRELEGALKKVAAYANLYGQEITVEIVDMALADLIRKPTKVTVDDVISVICAHYQVTSEALCGSSRARSIAYPRQVVMYMARTETDASLPQIGQQLGNRDHTTIMYGHNKIEALVEKDPAVRREMLELKSILYEKRPIYT